ncbi:hypothetical protein [Duganella violaceipulchra]|uniref:Uncharacterized protein n=1 Tax=Duganella violaceipulchra TaxID=2849652 RepID=A0AA41H4G5_9BURK|nr:hypothetical protein [Duganella violaceicalia]MBV6321082.1 hypothetical protein [Duganella violaceicalia]MCP2009672.1 hypothetical protein [Duganella violaceicalia]
MCDEELDVSKYVSVPHPIAKLMGRTLTIGLAHTDIDYFKVIGDEIGLSPEQVIQIYLRNIVYTGYKVEIDLPPLQREKAQAVVGESL